jgi:hypothetical protein
MILFIYTIYFNIDFNIVNTWNRKTHVILAQNFRENNADFDYVGYVFLIWFSIFLARKIDKTHIISAQNTLENNNRFEVNMLFIFYFDFNIFNTHNSKN